VANPTVFNAIATNPGGTGSTITVTLSTHAVGDLLIIYVANTGNVLWTGNPTGWSRIDQRTVGTSTNGIVGTWLWRKVVSGDTLPLTNPQCTLGATVTRLATCRTIRGADLESPFVTPNYGQRGFSTGTSNPARPPTVVTSAPEMLALHCYGSRAATNAPDPSGYTADAEAIASGTLVINAASQVIADQNTSLSNQDASPTSGARWASGIICIPSKDYPYSRAGSQGSQLNGTSVNVTLPTGTTSSDVNGNKDLIIATVEAVGTAPSPNSPGDWTEVGGAWSGTTSGGATTIRKYWALYDGSIDARFNRTGSGEISACLTTYYNCHQTAPVGLSDADARASSTTSTWDAVSRSFTHSLVQATCVADAVPTFTAPAGWTERMDGLGIACADQTFNATGSTASASFTLSTASPTLVGLVEIKSPTGVGSIDLIIQNAAHSHTAANAVLTQVHALVIANAAHSHSAGNIALTQVHELAVQNSLHSHSATSPVVTQVHALTVQGGPHAHTAESPTLTQIHVLSVASGVHSHSSENAVLVQAHQLTVSSATHDHTAESIALTQTYNLTIASGTHAHSSENVSIVIVLGVDAATHGHLAQNVDLTQVHELVVANGAHAHIAESPALTQTHAIQVDDTSHAHVADSTTLTQVHILTVADAVNGHTAASLSLIQVHELAVADSAHSHAAQSVALVQEHALQPADASHAQTADSPTLTQVHALSVADATHGHSAASPSLTQSHELVVASTLHGHSAENADVNQAAVLVLQNATHEHSAETVGLTQAHLIAIDDGAHAHTAEHQVLTQIHNLTIHNSAHEHLTSSVVLSAATDLIVSDGAHSHTADGLSLTQTQNLSLQSAVHSHSADDLAISQAHGLAIESASHGHVAQNVVLGLANALVISNSVHGHTTSGVLLVWPIPIDMYVIPESSQFMTIPTSSQIFQIDR